MSQPLLGVGGGADVAPADEEAPARDRLYSLREYTLRTNLVDEEMVSRWTLSSLASSSWLFLLVLGVLTALIAWVMDETVHGLEEAQQSLRDRGGNWLGECLLWTLFRLGVLLAAVGVTHAISPHAVGSGIPEMRSILGGFHMPDYLGLRVLPAKAMGIVLGLASGASIGKEGPFVHTSCILANNLMQLPAFRELRDSDTLWHQIMCAACAVGVSSTFGAPVGGVLFSIEVTSSFYMRSSYWRAFFCAICAAVVFRELELSGGDDQVALFSTSFEALPYESAELLAFFVLAVVCGLLGAAWVRTFAHVARTRRRHQRLVARNPYLFTAAYAAVTGVVCFIFGAYMTDPLRDTINGLFTEGNLDKDTWHRPTIFLTLPIFAALQFVFTAAAITLPLPAGVITPVFAIGAALGRFWGELLHAGTASIVPGGYAVVGAAAFTASVTGTISIAVIVFELTSQLSYSVPVLFSVLVGRAVGSLLSTSVYDTISRDRALPTWPQLRFQDSYAKTAADVVERDLAARVDRVSTRQQLQALLRESSAAVFPVVDDPDLVYVGAVSRSSLERCLREWNKVVPTQEFQYVDAAGAVRSEPLSLGPSTLSDQQQAVLRNDERVDLVAHGLIDTAALAFHVPLHTPLNDVFFQFSLHKTFKAFVTDKGRLAGHIDIEELDCRQF